MDDCKKQLWWNKCFIIIIIILPFICCCFTNRMVSLTKLSSNWDGKTRASGGIRFTGIVRVWSSCDFQIQIHVCLCPNFKSRKWDRAGLEEELRPSLYFGSPVDPCLDYIIHHSQICNVSCKSGGEWAAGPGWAESLLCVFSLWAPWSPRRCTHSHAHSDLGNIFRAAQNMIVDLLHSKTTISTLTYLYGIKWQQQSPYCKIKTLQ